SKLRLDLPLILPDVDDVEDHCVQRLTKALEGRPGISEAHIVRDANGQPQLCLHYDQAIVSIARLRELVGSAGARLSERFSHLTIRADGPLHARAARSVAVDLRSVIGVLEADVSGSGSIRIEFDRQLVSVETLRAKAAALGIRANGAVVPLKNTAPETPSQPSRSGDEPTNHAKHNHAGHKHSGPGHSDHSDDGGHDHGKKGAGGHAVLVPAQS
ncbi:hypothetical protein, partial [Pseudomonas aeruginosa]